jgi:hypothetical protein
MFAIDLHSRHFHPHFHFHINRNVWAILVLMIAVGLVVLIVAMPSKTSGRTSAAEFVDTPVFVLPIDPTFAF